MIEIPLSSKLPNYTQTTSLEGTAYKFDVRWNTRDETWRISIADTDGNAILSGLKLLPYSPLIQRYKLTNFISGELVGINTANQYEPPTRNNLGTDFKLFYLTQDEINEAV
ncbi:phage baseplate plug family protein [Piscirickettsia litoralis]|uniref:Cyanophage baseplate Pam3 plug gp18 domain-containing protein n=1 Tax=Piscirickettsia litoralis TaxID=1891921 RepID=A0ABX2ZYU3_9GAMM|nr:hypothetical protein [Piscirickettsia litoralis]ODN41182.1 hypothetical protein BGC07_17365 [Piscirickettsia litoralis]